MTLLVAVALFVTGCVTTAEVDPEVDDSDVPVTAADCFRTLGDNCTCDAKCLTRQELDAIDDFCDLGCMWPDPYPWDCAVEDGQCVVVWPP